MRNTPHLLVGALAVVAATLSLSACGPDASGPPKPAPSGSGSASASAPANETGGANGGKAGKASTKGLDPCKALSGNLDQFKLDSPIPTIPNTGERGCNFMFQGAAGSAVTINYWDTKAWKDIIVGGSSAQTTSVTVDGHPAKETRSTGPGLCDVIVPIGRHSTAEAEARGHGPTSNDPVCQWAEDAAKEMATKLPK
ncbi:DUF3558 family protein [Pseudonocardia acidicola]|uniref:DUF3558 family protein n=1 Tax=Pseudonocardia acidicola TaxID=2724939 RepID=A0ABX1S5W4_9PSEU|nr:DUF3558 family protein [Pseudonocardia acidicola]